MMYKASEQDIGATVNDFVAFCRFLDENKPVLSKQRSELGKNALYEINSLLNFKKEVAAPNFKQESYPVIDLMFNLALLGKLYVKAADAKGNLYLCKTARKDEFDGLNIFEKYTFLFETFWTLYDIEEIVRWGLDGNYIDKVVQTIAKSNPGEELRKGAFSQSIERDPAFSYLSVIIKCFNYFGFCRFIPIVVVSKSTTRYDDSIEAVIPTEFGVNICKVLVQHEIGDWNIPLLKELYPYEKDILPGIPYQSKVAMLSFIKNKGEQGNTAKLYNEVKKSGFTPLYKYLEPVFPEGVLNGTVIAVINQGVKGSYDFKVSYGKDVWRKVKLSYKHTLEDLHLVIQRAFDFDNDHLYSFFMDAKKYSKHAYHAPMCDEAPFVDEAKIGELELYEKQKILYLFDYGDSWIFEVQLLKINRDEVPPKMPQIIEAKGEAPKQYGYYEEDDE